MPDGESFWYRRETVGGTEEFVRVDRDTGKKTIVSTRHALDLPPPPTRRSSVDGLWKTGASSKGTAAIAVTFANETSEPVDFLWYDYFRNSKRYGTIPPGGKLVTKTFQGHRWHFENTRTKKAVAILITQQDGETLVIDGPPPQEVIGEGPGVSPDTLWKVQVTGREVTLVNRKTKQSSRFTCVLPADAAFMGTVNWSPDSSAFMVPAVVDVERRKVRIIESSPKDSLHPKMQEFDYIKPGDPLPKAVPVIFRVGEADGRIVADDLFPTPYQTASDLRGLWPEDGTEFFFDYNQRGHQLYRIVAVNSLTAEARVVVEDRSSTFIDCMETWRHWLPASGELLWKSERDGWKHLWLIDVQSGAVKQQITCGEWGVRNVLHVDEASRQIWFMACGLNPGEDSCQQHLCGVDFDGNGFMQLTEGDGEHEIQFSPNRRFFLDTCSRADARRITSSVFVRMNHSSPN